MDRNIVYPGAIPLDTDLLNSEKNAFYGLGWLAEALLGTGAAVVGLAVQPTTPASLQVTVAPGAIFSLQTVDTAAYGSLGTDGNQIVKQGLAPAAQALTLTPPSTTGFSTNFLVQAAFSEVDDNPVVLPYYNASNPAVAWSGPNNAGTAQNTTRQDKCIVSLKAGTPAATGSQTTPAPDAGCIGLFVITVANGQTQVTSGNISQLSTAPFFPALPAIPAAVQSSEWIFAIAGGTANALTAAFSPPISAYAAGIRALVKITAANTAAVTLDGGAGALPIKTRSGADLKAGDLLVGNIIPLICTGSTWQLDGMAYSEVIVPTPTSVTLYVRSDGSDSNNGSANTSGSAFRTLNGALAYIAAHLSTSYPITLQLGIAGTYAAPNALFAGAAIKIVGNTSSPGSYILASPTSGASALSVQNAYVSLSGVTVQNNYNSTHCIDAVNGGLVDIDTVTIQNNSGITSSALLRAGYGGSIRVLTAVTLAANGQAAFLALANGVINVNVGATTTFSGSPTYSLATALAQQGGVIIFNGNAPTGSASGPRYLAQTNGVIDTAGGGGSYIPGSTAGSTATGGQYN